jgi:hypothetical protein
MSLIKPGRMVNGKIDLTDANNLSDKVLGEQETRKKFLQTAREYGFEKDMLLLFAKYDNLLKLAKDEKERKDIKKLAIYEIWKRLGGGGELIIDGELVYKDS